MVRQYRRRPAGRSSRSRPGRSTSTRTTGAIEDPELAAPRELEEETGYAAGLVAPPDVLLDGARVRDGADAPLPRDGPDASRTKDRLGPDEDERLELERRAAGARRSRWPSGRDPRREVDRRAAVAGSPQGLRVAATGASGTG